MLRQFPAGRSGHSALTALTVTALLVALLLASCDATQRPLAGHEFPTAAPSSLTAEWVGQKMLAEIEDNESKLGRALAPARIVRIQLLQRDETYLLNHLDGSNPDGSRMSPDGGPGWMVEAVGTFLEVDPQTGQIEAIGTHGFRRWDFAGSEGFALIPCWSRVVLPPAQMEGTCTD